MVAADQNHRARADRAEPALLRSPCRGVRREGVGRPGLRIPQAPETAGGIFWRGVSRADGRMAERAEVGVATCGLWPEARSVRDC